MTPPDPKQEPAQELPPAEELRAGRYAMLGLLGAGSQGETLDAVDKREGRPVAIKRFKIRGARSWKDVELAEREATVLSSLSHPSLPSYVEHFEENGALYLVMEKVDGESLAARQQRGAALSSAQVVRYLNEAAACLGYLHGHAPPIVHRDIKPGNVILRPDGSYCLVDFGSVGHRLKPHGGSTVVGTFGFMAPEQFQGRAVPGSDVYAVGATALSLLSGSQPEDLPHKGLAIDVPRALGNHVDRRLVHALGRMLEPDPDRRAPSIKAALLEAGLGPQGDEPRAPAGTKHRRGHSAHAEAEANRNASRRERREAQRQRESERRRERKAKRAERRHGRSAGRRSPVPPGVLIGIAILVALRVAGVVTYATFRVLLPILFAVLAVFLGRHLYRKAQRMSEIGRAGEAGLNRAAEQIHQHFLGGETPPQPERQAHPKEPGRPTRVRVDAASARPAESREQAIDTEAGAAEDDAEARAWKSGR